jgi:hypothetical protein
VVPRIGPSLHLEDVSKELGLGIWLRALVDLIATLISEICLVIFTKDAEVRRFGIGLALLMLSRALAVGLEVRIVHFDIGQELTR